MNFCTLGPELAKVIVDTPNSSASEFSSTRAFLRFLLLAFFFSWGALDFLRILQRLTGMAGEGEGNKEETSNNSRPPCARKRFFGMRLLPTYTDPGPEHGGVPGRIRGGSGQVWETDPGRIRGGSRRIRDFWPLLMVSPVTSDFRHPSHTEY